MSNGSIRRIQANSIIAIVPHNSSVFGAYPTYMVGDLSKGSRCKVLQASHSHTSGSTHYFLVELIVIGVNGVEDKSSKPAAQPVANPSNVQGVTGTQGIQGTYCGSPKSIDLNKTYPKELLSEEPIARFEMSNLGVAIGMDLLLGAED